MRRRSGLKMKTRNQIARVIQSVTAIVMLAAGMASLTYVKAMTWYNAPALILGVYCLFTKKLLVSWNGGEVYGKF